MKKVRKMSICNLCPRNCSSSRNDREGRGFCKAPDLPRIARAGLHFGEEPFISGKNGSGTIFLSGCSLGCVFCQNADISQNLKGKTVSVERLSEIIFELENQGAENINFVTPTHYIDKIEEALKIYKPKIPLVYNSGAYDLTTTIHKDIFDIYLFDLKFYSKEKSIRYASCDNYFDVASKAIKLATQIKGAPQFNASGMMNSGVVVRHLLLPQGTNEAIKIIDWLNNNTPDIIFSLMSQYVPLYRANEFAEINRKITKRECDKVCEYCYDKKFADIFIQSLKSSTTEFIPKFDLSGV